MRPFSIIPLLAPFLLLAASPASPPASTADGELAALRERLEAAPDRAAWNEVAETLLAALDDARQSESSEANWLVSRLLEARPDDPKLLWRRAEHRRRLPDDRGAIEDLERLTRAHPGHPLALRARRALPALYLRTGMHAKSARADEALLRERLADPVAVLTRLARTYAGMGQLSSVESTLARLDALAPDRARYDPELSWLRVAAIDRLGSRDEAAGALLEFANLFPWDSRRAEALLMAARAHEESGRTTLAIALAGEAMESAGDERIASEARLLRGTLLGRTGDRDGARDEYLALLESASSPELVATALQRMIDVEVEQRGADAALLMLAGLAERGDRFTRPMARMHVERLLSALAERIADEPRDAAFHVELARRLDADLSRSPHVVLAAARFRDRLGQRDVADALFRAIDPQDVEDPATKERVRRAHARSTPAANEPAELAADDDLVERLRELERSGSHEEIRNVVHAALSDEDRVGPLPPPARLIAARAALALGDETGTLSLLEPLESAEAAAAVMRGDAEALSGSWERACAAYDDARRGRSEPVGASPLTSWIELRLAACALRSGRREEGRGRLEALLAKDPGDPVSFAATDLLERIDSFPSKATHQAPRLEEPVL